MDSFVLLRKKLVVSAILRNHVIFDQLAFGSSKQVCSNRKDAVLPAVDVGKIVVEMLASVLMELLHGGLLMDSLADSLELLKLIRKFMSLNGAKLVSEICGIQCQAGRVGLTSVAFRESLVKFLCYLFDCRCLNLPGGPNVSPREVDAAVASAPVTRTVDEPHEDLSKESTIAEATVIPIRKPDPPLVPHVVDAPRDALSEDFVVAEATVATSRRPEPPPVPHIVDELREELSKESTIAEATVTPMRMPDPPLVPHVVEAPRGSLSEDSVIAEAATVTPIRMFEPPTLPHVVDAPREAPHFVDPPLKGLPKELVVAEATASPMRKPDQAPVSQVVEVPPEDVLKASAIAGASQSPVWTPEPPPVPHIVDELREELSKESTIAETTVTPMRMPDPALVPHVVDAPRDALSEDSVTAEATVTPIRKSEPPTLPHVVDAPGEAPHFVDPPLKGLLKELVVAEAAASPMRKSDQAPVSHVVEVPPEDVSRASAMAGASEFRKPEPPPSEFFDPPPLREELAMEIPIREVSVSPMRKPEPPLIPHVVVAARGEVLSEDSATPRASVTQMPEPTLLPEAPGQKLSKDWMISETGVLGRFPRCGSVYERLYQDACDRVVRREAVRCEMNLIEAREYARKLNELAECASFDFYMLN